MLTVVLTGVLRHMLRLGVMRMLQLLVMMRRHRLMLLLMMTTH